MMTPFAFRVLGAVSNVRQLVDYSRVFRAYCSADPVARPEVPADLAAFVAPVEFRRHLAPARAARDYCALVGLPAVKWELVRDHLDGHFHIARRIAALPPDAYRRDNPNTGIGSPFNEGL